MPSLFRKFSAPVGAVALLCGVFATQGAAALSITDLGDTDADGFDPTLGAGVQIVGDSIEIDLSGFFTEALSIGEVENDFDTLSFTLHAPAGLLIGSVDYQERLYYEIEDTNGNDDGDAFILATGSVKIGGSSSSLGNFSDTNIAATSFQLDPAAVQVNQESVDIVITNSIIAASFGDTARLWKGLDANKDPVKATLGVTIVPVPAAVWLLGSALLGLVMVGRTRARRA